MMKKMSFFRCTIIKKSNGTKTYIKNINGTPAERLWNASKSLFIYIVPNVPNVPYKSKVKRIWEN